MQARICQIISLKIRMKLQSPDSFSFQPVQFTLPVDEVRMKGAKGLELGISVLQ